MTKHIPIDARIAAVTTPQLRLAHVTQLAAVGVDSHAIARRIVQGRMTKVFPTVIHDAPTDTPLTREQCELASDLAAGTGSGLWADTSAARLGMWSRPDDQIHVVSQTCVSHDAPFDVTFHRSTHATPEVFDRTHPIATTSPLETIRTCGLTNTPLQIASMLYAGVYERYFSLEDVGLHLEKSRGRPGVAVARAGFQLRLMNSSGTRCRSEDRFCESWTACGFELPLVNVRGCTPLPDYEPDFAWAAERFVLAIDGDQHRNDPIQARIDAAVDARLDELGWESLRIDWRDVWSAPHHVVDLVRSRLAARG